MVLRQQFSTLWSFSLTPFQIIGVGGGAQNAGQQIMTAGRTTAVYSSLKTPREVPYVEAVSLVRTLV
jgi:hypothetical protein